ncbi:Stage III sporulation protein AF (Spore_III_AF) [Sporomusa ovata DSM 2662]|uniref:Stage III sporulation protein AF n=1 Tax=Sporomusa ovata TaxID=2378 RepID=A0A0U1L4M0_9FIRM|nr:stage III sporulation protein AF [Sporomusa ovata]EQB25488.1 stage III sporulation protein AF [Sporomusa ovata DSM 2662]CQR74053.1 Stage III sporulation protein AF [Sporomusa ovata]
MIAFITAWIKGIIFVVLFAAFLELLLPNNSMQRFVRVIMGLFIMLAILNPIIGVIEHQVTADQLPVLAARVDSNLAAADVLQATNNVAEKREQLARDLYVKDLSRQIRATVMAVDGVADAKVVVTIDNGDTGPQKTSKAMGKLKHVVVYLEPGITASERKISQVTVGVSISGAAPEAKKLPAVVVDKVTRVVTELYQLRSSQVEVRWMN